MTNNNSPIPTATVIPTAITTAVEAKPLPKKYITVNGIMKLNPEYQKWALNNNNTATTPVTTVPNPTIAIPIISNMDDYQQISDQEIPLTSLTTNTIQKVQEPEFCLAAGLEPDQALDAIFQIFAKYEIPMGLLNKLIALSEYDSLEFIIDDSGSMRSQSDTYKNPLAPHQGYQTRWQEAKQRLKEMMEVLSNLPIQKIGIEFLNRPNRIVLQKQQNANTTNPHAFLADAYAQIDAVFCVDPIGTTPAYEKLQESLQSYSNNQEQQPMKIARYFFGDGVPNGGLLTQQKIITLLQQRPNPRNNPITFISCTNEDDQVEWMKTAEEIIPYCSESDDFDDEAREVLRDQGKALPYSRGFHLICQLVAAMNPDDLDAMDESVPFTKQTLDHLLGMTSTEETYRHYFHHYTLAQRSRKIEEPSDTIKKNIQWNYQQFLTTPVAKDIPQVKEFQQRLLQQQQRQKQYGYQQQQQQQRQKQYGFQYQQRNNQNQGVDSECTCVIL